MAKIVLTPEILLAQREKMLQLQSEQQAISTKLKDAVNTMNEGLTDNLRHNAAAKTSMVLHYSKSFEDVLGWGAQAIAETVEKYQQTQSNIIEWINNILGNILPGFNSGSGSSAGVVTVNENGSIPDTPWTEINPYKTNAEGQRSASAYNEVLADLDVANRYRYQPRNGNTYCNIYVWDATKAMGCEIPHFYDPNTGMETASRQAGTYLEMSASRMTNWLRDFGAQNGWIECDEATAIAMANKGMPTVAAATTTGHVAMVTPQNEGETGVMISQAGGRNFEHGSLQSGFGSHQVKYYYHA